MAGYEATNEMKPRRAGPAPRPAGEHPCWKAITEYLRLVELEGEGLNPENMGCE